jgi:hypothetical protein
LSTVDRLLSVEPDTAATLKVVPGFDVLKEQGFACVPVEGKDGRKLLVVSRTPRGLLEGANYVCNYLIH